MSSIWHYHESCGHKFRLDHTIQEDEPCPYCGRPFEKRIRHDCHGCNNVYFSDKSYQKNEQFICPISGESVIVKRLWKSRQYIYNTKLILRLIGLIIVIVIVILSILWLRDWLGAELLKISGILSESIDFLINFLITMFWLSIGVIVILLQFVLLSMTLAGILFILYVFLYDVIIQPVNMQKCLRDAASSDRPFTNVAKITTVKNGNKNNRLSKQIAEITVIETQEALISKRDLNVTQDSIKEIANSIDKLIANAIVSDFSRESKKRLSRDIALIIKPYLMYDISDKTIDMLAKEIADAVYWKTAELILQKATSDNLRTTRKQQLAISILIIGIGLGIVLCYLSKQTVQETKDYLQKLLSFNTINIVMFAILWYGVKLFGSRYGLGKILKSGNSFRQFAIMTPVLGTSNVIALLFVDRFINELSGSNISKIGMIILSDIILSVFLALFLERSPKEWITLFKTWLDKAKTQLTLTTK